MFKAEIIKSCQNLGIDHTKIYFLDLNDAARRRFHNQGNWLFYINYRIWQIRAQKFAKKLHNELNVPIGIIHASWGGSKAEAWASHDALKKINSFKGQLKQFETLIDLNQKSIDWFNNFEY